MTILIQIRGRILPFCLVVQKSCRTPVAYYSNFWNLAFLCRVCVFCFHEWEPKEPHKSYLIFACINIRILAYYTLWYNVSPATSDVMYCCHTHTLHHRGFLLALLHINFSLWSVSRSLVFRVRAILAPWFYLHYNI